MLTLPKLGSHADPPPYHGGVSYVREHFTIKESFSSRFLPMIQNMFLESHTIVWSVRGVQDNAGIKKTCRYQKSLFFVLKPGSGPSGWDILCTVENTTHVRDRFLITSSSMRERMANDDILISYGTCKSLTKK